ncbi:MAG: hypothetical protein J7K62_02400 [Thermoplasmata archaeon]|nr:hypothetical protein [Thermoplasmata archaeon]
MKEKIRVELKIGDPENPELHIVALSDEEPIDRFLKFLGLRRSPPENVNCPHKDYCTDYPDKCGECAHNYRRSYFTPKEEASE